jgi:hypothetical protein
MSTPLHTERTWLHLGKRGAFEGVVRWPWMASGMGTDEARTTPTNEAHDSPHRWVEKVARSITNSETPQSRRPGTSIFERRGSGSCVRGSGGR